MKTIALWCVWSLVVFGLAGLGWVRIRRHMKVYLLILESAVYLTGIFVLYGLSKGVLTW